MNRQILPRLSVVAAARPNFMKVGPVLQALRGRASVELIHTGQHYDHAMSQAFFADLGLPEPDINLGVGSGSHAEQMAGVMTAFERRLSESPSDAVVVVGDVNSTLATALVAAKLQVPIAHVEAGLRSRDWSMPEEVNRVLTDRLSAWLFTPSEDGDVNLLAEGIEKDRIFMVGNVMIDTLLEHVAEARTRAPHLRESLGLSENYAMLTLHRPSNVDEMDQLMRLLGAIGEIGKECPVIFPVHPRTRAQLAERGLPPSIHVVDPYGYIDFLGLLSSARLALTDSGGIQEETSVLGIPCLTLRHNTERPITVELGTNRIVGTDPDIILAAATDALSRSWSPAEIPLWDGMAGQRIADILLTDLS
jgi:UDP-N-acetylglucosamine 2-epimerase (non-hydrolysing)